MKIGSITTGIVSDGLVLNMDAANRASYPTQKTLATAESGSCYNTLDLTQSGSFISDPQFLTQPISASSWVFDGVDDYIDCGSFTPLDSGSGATISAWFKSSTYSSLGRLVNVEKHIEIFQGSSGASNTQGRFTYVLMGAHGNSFKTLGGTEATGVGNLVDGDWHHLCFVFSGANLTATIYEDGVAVLTGDTNRGNLNSATDKLYIGADPAGANPITGNIANTQLYNRALSANEVLHNYNALKGRFS
tara:strand:- start:11441 stop:12181 length:741 start_codon:yes stop_codon:yes gene_type:complete